MYSAYARMSLNTSTRFVENVNSPAATHYCSHCLRDTAKKATELDAPRLVLPTSPCEASGREDKGHHWESFISVLTVVHDPVQVLSQIMRKPLSDEVGRTLMYNEGFIVERHQLQTNTFNPHNGCRLLSRLENVIHTSTQFALESSDYLFDCPIPIAGGQSDTVLEYVAFRSRICCAKIGSPATIDYQSRISHIIHEGQTVPTIMPVHAVITVRNNTSHAMISPYYPRSVAHFLFSPAMPQKHQMLADIALSGLASIKAFFNKGYCHGDIKPANMMLSAIDNNAVVLIDFGSSVLYGRPIPKTTAGYCLDVPPEGSLSFDLTCLACSLVQLIHGDFKNMDRHQFCNVYEESAHFIAKIAVACVSGTDNNSNNNTDLKNLWHYSCDIISALGLQCLEGIFV